MGRCARSSGRVEVGGASLDHNRLNLLGHNCACGATVIIGRVVVVHGRVLVTLLAPAPSQQTRDRQGCQTADNNTCNSAARDFTGLLLHGHRAICGSDNRGRGGVSRSGGGDKGGGTLAGTVLEGATIRVGQASDTTAFEKTLDVGRML